MTKLSVNINKVATLRNARGADEPNVVRFAIECQNLGAQGITVHPRPDQRHIRYQDVFDLQPVLIEEFNIEGNPVPQFIELVKQVRPSQVTLVPDAENVLTSNAGWDTVKHRDYLRDIVAEFKSLGIRVSVFVDPVAAMVEGAAQVGADRIELYTESYAKNYPIDREQAVRPYVEAAKVAQQCALGINAGHDLSLVNLKYLRSRIPYLDEVSIGHALISDALYLGIAETIRRYRQCLE